MIEIRDLRNLMSLAEHGHFGRAAVAVGLGQPALTKSLQRLEKRLGGRLLDRSRTEVTPTSLGEVVISHAKEILDGVAELERSVSMLCGLKVGSLTVGIGPAMSESYVTNALALLAAQHPHVQIHVRVDDWRQLSEWLVAKDIELLIAELSEMAGDNRFICTPLPTEEFTWFCRASHPMAGRKLLTRRDLLRFPLATPRMPPWAVNWFAEAIDDENWETTQALPTVQCENYSMLKRIVQTSDCISVALTATIRTELDQGQLISLPVDAPTLTTNAGIVQLRNRTVSPIAEKFIETLRSTASEANNSS